MVQVGHRMINQARHASLVDRTTTPEGCHPWTGITNNIGYGFIGYWDIDKNKNNMMTAHRMALMIKLNREIAPGLNANHTCHNRLCCNPDHLYEGTQREKIHAMQAQGRLARVKTGARGSYQHKQHNREYKYSEQDITWIRDAEIEDIMVRYSLSRIDSINRRWTFRNNYNWLPWNTDQPY